MPAPSTGGGGDAVRVQFVSDVRVAHPQPPQFSDPLDRFLVHRAWTAELDTLRPFDCERSLRPLTDPAGARTARTWRVPTPSISPAGVDVSTPRSRAFRFQPLLRARSMSAAKSRSERERRSSLATTNPSAVPASIASRARWRPLGPLSDFPLPREATSAAQVGWHDRGVPSPVDGRPYCGDEEHGRWP
jgi:hypothetical protein